jgi:hypothetical protein
MSKMGQPGFGDDEKPRTHRLSVPASEPIRWRNKDWPTQPESCWRVRCTCGQSFSSVDHGYAVAESQAHLVISGAASPLSSVYHLAKQFLAGNRELDELVREDPDYTLADLLRDAVEAIPQPRQEPEPENRERNEQRRVEPKKKLCHYCYELFEPKKSNQDYCSRSHKQLAYLRRKKNAAARLTA